MGKGRSISSIENDILMVEAEMIKTQKKYDELADHLKVLQYEKRDYEAKRIVDAFRRSEKSFEEVMNFCSLLQSWPTGWDATNIL